MRLTSPAHACACAGLVVRLVGCVWVLAAGSRYMGWVVYRENGPHPDLWVGGERVS
jgi:hypothetical protein